MPQPTSEELWKKIVVIHNAAKAHLIYCEEAGLDHKTFLQPRNEFCNALEHIVRAKSGELGLNASGSSADYQLGNLDKALGHEYRAFFDICDWLTLTLRERIRKDLEPYASHTEVIQQVIPNYYTEIKPGLESLVSRIAEIRNRKDIKGDVLEEVQQYNKIVSEMRQFADALSAKIPSLQELKNAKEAQERKEHAKENSKLNLSLRNAIIAGILIAVLGAVLTVAGRRLFPDSQVASAPPPAPPGAAKKQSGP